ncbi:AT-rich interactive domain-containing protein 5B-like isoform X3 [Portunus trituberculatus]|uniref:AT-rich interactive domain-containing protein 5B-like isoform X3 n=1 Tax=Portunus trituberculatus TaxID=210409 RepID=UPI001E1D1543|nr:AT-rich interactive domain-containing protein 5B-like isoform X3 [Portunus trituberculatus]
MTNHKIQFVGAPCGHHGNYTFYKAFKYNLHGNPKILSLGEFFFIKIWEDEEIISIGEAQLLWEDRTSGQILVSLRIYFLPENTPEGRCEEHGEHEVVSLAEKVVLRAEDVIGWMRAAVSVKWDTGLLGVYGPPSQDPANDAHYTPPISGALDIEEVIREKKLIGDVVEPNSVHVIILAFDKYCRIRGLLKRLEGVEEEYMRSRIVVALGGFVVPSRRTRMLFCRDVFDYPELEGHDLLCNHLSPKLQGRPRKKRKKPTDSESESSETSEDIRPRLKGKPGLTAKHNGLRVLDRKSSSRSHLSQVKNDFSTPALNRLIEVDFMSKLNKFMKDRNTPITRLPHIGYKQLNVFELFTRVQQLGGFEAVGEKKLWKQLYEELSGSAPSSHPPQSAQSYASMMKRHYERLLLPYEKFLLAEQKKLLGIGSPKPNKIKSDPGEPSVSILQVPKVNTKKEPNTIPADLAKRPEITITPIPRSMGPLGMPEGFTGLLDPSLSVMPPGLQLADLMALEGVKATLGMSALQDLAKIAERYEKPLQEPATKRLKTDSTRVNGASSRDKDSGRPSVIQEPPLCKPPLPAVPGLVPADFLRQMNLLDSNAKLLLPAHQSNKTISALAQLLPQTSIFPAPAPAAHQHPVTKSLRDPIGPEPPRVFQSPSVYSQSKHMYGKPTTDVRDLSKDNKSTSPEIEILDLSRASTNRNGRSTKTERPEIELLDLSTRRDITVSSVAKPGTSKNSNIGRVPPPHVSIKSSDPVPRHSPSKNPAAAAAAAATGVSAAALAAAAQGLPPGLSLAPALLPYLNPMLAPGVKPNSGAGGPPLSMFPFMDPTAFAAYYSMLPHSLIPTTSSGGGSSSGSASAVHHMAQAHLQLSSLGLPGISGLSPDALNSLGMYKNFLPQGNLPAPHFLSGLMSPHTHNHNPPTTK